MKKLFLFAIVVLGFAASSVAQDTKTASSSVTITTPITLTNNDNLVFGNVSVSGLTAGTVQLAATVGATRTPALGVTLPANTGTFSAAKFTVNGEATYTYSIVLANATISLSGPGTAMLLDLVTDHLTGTGTLTGGSDIIYVGGTLHVGAGQLAGAYTNPTGLSVTVNYN